MFLPSQAHSSLLPLSSLFLSIFLTFSTSNSLRLKAFSSINSENQPIHFLRQKSFPKSNTHFLSLSSISFLLLATLVGRKIQKNPSSRTILQMMVFCLQWPSPMKTLTISTVRCAMLLSHIRIWHLCSYLILKHPYFPSKSLCFQTKVLPSVTPLTMLFLMVEAYLCL